MKAVVLVSGGLDSTTLLHYVTKELKRDVKALTILYGQRHAKEIKCAQYQCNLLSVPYDILDLSFLGEFLNSSSLIASSSELVPHIQEVLGDPQPSTYVPNRNMMFLSMAVAFAENVGASEVYFGAQQHDLYGYFDTTLEFVNRMNYVLELNRKSNVKIMAPFVNHRKSEIIRIGVHLDVDYSHTFSCYQGREEPCGICATCAERIAGFKELGMEDPLEYA